MDQIVAPNDKALTAIQLKYLGNSYTDIAERVGLEVSTIKSWFMRSGRLYKAYTDYCVAESNLKREIATNRFMRSLDRATQVMDELLESGDDRIRLAAAKEIIARHMDTEEKITENELKEERVNEMLEALNRFEDEEENN